MKNSILFAVMMMIGASAAFAMSPMPPKAQLTGQAAPDFVLPTLKGGERSLTQLREGKKSILFFWATWCPHCHEELLRLKTSLSGLDAEDVRMILVNLGETAADVQRYNDNNGFDWDVVLDQTESLSEAYMLIGVPTFVFIDENGIVKNVKHELPVNVRDVFR